MSQQCTFFANHAQVWLMISNYTHLALFEQLCLFFAVVCFDVPSHWSASKAHILTAACFIQAN